MNHINFILSLKGLEDIQQTEAFIKELSVPHTSNCNEPNTRSFEWFLNKEKNTAVILESFRDSEAAVLRVENLVSSPVNEPFQNLFDVLDFTVLGNASDSLRDILESWKPNYLNYEGGFNKTL
jgi:hypothetical protein|tara:strand:+ start:1191 stop:1559 length:369 start_codon:yes stop_codon:yes gene_type:complete